MRLSLYAGLVGSVLLGVALLTSCAQRQATTEHAAAPLPGSATPGRQTDGSILLHNQWSLRPAGRQVEIGDFPVNIAVHPKGQFAVVLHAGYSAHHLLVIDIPSGKVVSRQNVPETFYGLTFTKDGQKLYCSGAGKEVVHEFEFRDGQLQAHREIQLREPKKKGVPAGLAIAENAGALYVANVWGHRVTRVQLKGEANPLDLMVSTNASSLVESTPLGQDFDTAAANKRAQAAIIESNPGDTFPYACVVDEKHQRLYVSLWAKAGVAVLDLKEGRLLTVWPTQEHPCEMVLTRSGRFLYVANANRNTVSILDTENGRTIENIWAALFPDALPGSTPNSLALSPDERTLFVAIADNDAVAVFDVSTPGKSRSLGFIPAGWYPTSVRVTPDGRKLLVANGRGILPKANPLGPQPGRDSTNRTVQYIGGLYKGTLAIVDLPARGKLEHSLKTWTADTYRCSPLLAGAKVGAPREASNPVPGVLGEKSPIKYCLYIIKENRTYDQVLGDLPQGKGDPTLCLFPEAITPNHHKLAREFVLLDNFYVNSEVSADGHEWTMGAYATDFVKKMWPLAYGHNGSDKYPYPSEGNFDIAAPVRGYLWDRALEAGVSFRSYGEFVGNGKTPADPGKSKVKSLAGHYDPYYRSFDLTYPDRKRAERFISELKRFEAEGDMPRLQILRLPNDHTHGTTAKMLTPTALVADNDVGLGMVIEALTKSKFWPELAIFVLEDDAQNGSDHVDAHRSPAFVISPYTRKGSVDSTMYSTTSMLRTIELILGLKPMTQFDAAATPMFRCFQANPDTTPYTAVAPGVNLDERNGVAAWGSDLKLNFAEEDAADDLLLNEMVWRSIRGNDSPMPAPVRAGFVFSRGAGKDED